MHECRGEAQGARWATVTVLCLSWHALSPRACQPARRRPALCLAAGESSKIRCIVLQSPQFWSGNGSRSAPAPHRSSCGTHPQSNARPPAPARAHLAAAGRGDGVAGLPQKVQVHGVIDNGHARAVRRDLALRTRVQQQAVRGARRAEALGPSKKSKGVGRAWAARIPLCVQRARSPCWGPACAEGATGGEGLRLQQAF